MTLEPLWLAVILVLVVFSTALIFISIAKKDINALAYKLITFVVGWVLMIKYSAGPRLWYFVNSEAPIDYKIASFSGAILIVLDYYFILKFIVRKGRTNWNDRFYMFVTFGLSQGATIFWLNYLAGVVCAPFTVWIQMCTDYPIVGKFMTPVAIVSYWLMTLITNDENTRSVVTTFGHMVADSKEGVDFVPEPVITIALLLQTLGIKNLFNISGHVENKSFAVQVDPLQFSSDGLQVAMCVGAGFEISDFVRFKRVGEAFAIASAQQDLTSIMASYIASKTAKDVHNLRLSPHFVGSFNQKQNPVERYGLQMISITPLKADYYDNTTRAFFNELGTISSRCSLLEDFMKEAKTAYDKLSLSDKSRFTLKEYLAMFLTISGKGPTFGQFGFNQK